jgi:predicted MFS family arabinose efflux permease
MLVLFVLAHWGHHLLSSVVPPLLPFIREDLNISVTAAGALVSVFTISYGISQLPSGWLADRIGQRWLILLSISGVALFGVLVGLMPYYGIMLALMVLMGLLGGGYHPSSAPLVSSLVKPERRGWALGIHQIGGTASNLTAPLIATGLATFLGWHSAFIIPGAVVVALGILLFWLLADYKRPASPRVASNNAEIRQKVSEASTPRAKLITYIVMGTAGQVFIGSVIAFLPLFAVDSLGVNEGLGAAIQAVIYLGGLPAGPIAGYLSDRLRAGRVLIVATLVAGPVIGLLFLVNSLWVSLPILFILGVLMFTIMPVSESYIISRTSDSNRSTVLGVYYAASRGGSGFLTLGIGYMIEITGFQSTFGIAGGILLVIIAASLLFLKFSKEV